MNAITLDSNAFSEVLDRLRRHGDLFHASPSEEWRQGRTLFGGLTAALAVTAARRAYPDLPPIRSAQFTFVGPATGGLAFSPQLLRAGKSAAFVEVRARSADETVLTATLTFGAARRSSHCYRALPMPEVLPPKGLGEFFTAPLAPVFSRQFEARVAGGARAISGAEKPELLLWLRHRDASAPDDIASILALGDVPPPAAMTMFTIPAPISTVTWSIDVVGEHFVGSCWHLAHIEAETVGEGYSSQRMTLWSAAGQPLLAARQTVAVFG
jgi:acyl-CoA thioesterase